MTLASKLLEGYYPEEGGYVLEGMTPEVMMNQVNAICTECITGLYEAAQQYFTDDIIGQAEVITEGAGIIDKIKEAIGKFIQKIKDIWAWFVKKVKAFPAWIKGLFTKSVESTTEVVAKVEKSIGVKHKMIPFVKQSIIGKYASALDDACEILKDFVKKTKESSKDRDPDAVLAELEKNMAAYGKMHATGGDAGADIIENSLTQYSNAVDAKKKEYDNMIVNLANKMHEIDKVKEMVDDAKQVEGVPITKILSDAKNYNLKSKKIGDEITKELDIAVKESEKTLAVLNGSGFQKKMEQVFIKGFREDGGKGKYASTAQSVAQTYIGTTSRKLSMTTAVLNKCMSISSKVASGYMDISSKYKSAAMKGKSGGGDGESGEKPADNKE